MHAAEHPPPRLADFVIIPVLYFLGARIGALTVMPEGTAILWPPNGILLAALIRFRARGYLPLAALILIAEIVADTPEFTVIEGIQFGLVNIGEVTLAYLLLARWRFDARFSSVTDLVKFVLVGPIIASFIAACFGGLIYEVSRGNETRYVEFVRIWWFGDALGLMIVTPLLAFWWTGRDRKKPRPRRHVVLDVLVGIGALVVTGLLVASRDGLLEGIHVGPVLLTPFVIYVAARSGLITTAGVIGAVALLLLLLTVDGRNPFGAGNPRSAVIRAQEFIFVTSLMALGLSALLRHVREGHDALEGAHRELVRRAAMLEDSNASLRRAEAEVTSLNAELEQRVAQRTRELQEALSQVKHLQGMLPICAWCKKVRDDQDYWHAVEDYITARTDAQFSHGICPECYARTLAELERGNH